MGAARSPIGRAAASLGRPVLLAHRGLHGPLAENSQAALEAAAGAGLDGVEFDVRFSRDGTPVIVHDATLLRTFGDERSVGDVDDVSLRRLGVPLLREVLAALPSNLLMNVEVKESPREQLVRVIREECGAGADSLIFSSFDLGVLHAIRILEPSWPVWLNVESAWPESLDQATALGVSGLSVEKGLLDSGRSDEVRAAGFELAVWTLRSRADRSYLARPGLVAACVEGEAV